MNNQTSGRVSLPADATAADHLVVRVGVVGMDATVGAALEAARAHPGRADVYVTDPEGRLHGTLPIATLIGSPDADPVAKHLQAPLESVSANRDQEEVALIAIRRKTNALPVHDDSGRFLGVVEAFDLLRVLHHEHIGKDPAF